MVSRVPDGKPGVARRDTFRGTGRTTRQIEAAPQKATFVWCNEHLSYPLALARKLKREDIQVVGPRWLIGGHYAGHELKGLVVDHAAFECNSRDEEAMHENILRAQAYIRP